MTSIFDTFTPRSSAAAHLSGGELTGATSPLVGGLDENERYRGALESCLSAIRQTLGTDCLLVPSEPDGSTRMINILSLQALQQAPDAADLLRQLVDAMRTLASASKYSPCIKSFSDYSLPVHNGYINERLSSNYSFSDFSELLEYIDMHGVFSLSIDPTSGLAQTCDAKENCNMSARRWVTDTVRCGDLQRERDPSSWQKALLSLARFYNQPEELAAMERIIGDPACYRTGGPLAGVAHSFMPHTMRRDPSWFNNKRLESHGLALRAFCDALYDGLRSQAPWGLRIELLEADDHLFAVVNAIVHLATFLASVNLALDQTETARFDFMAPSTGIWEEIPFADGLTWDIESTRAGFESLHRLLFDIEVNEHGNIALIRKLITEQPNGQWLNDEALLSELISSARAKILQRLGSGAHPCEHPLRPADAALAFISNSTIRLGDTVRDDAISHLRVLDFLAKNLVRDNGMIRYAPFAISAGDGRATQAFDSYLAGDYWAVSALRAHLHGGGEVIPWRFDSTSCSSKEEYLARALMSRPGLEAEWFMVSVMCEGYCRQVAKLLQHLAEHQAAPEEPEWKLLRYAQGKATEYINRSLARITDNAEQGKQQLKSNGKTCPAFAVPEAYERVTNLAKPALTVAIPGAHTPKAWAVASLYTACQRFLRNLQNLELLGGDQRLSGPAQQF